MCKLWKQLSFTFPSNRELIVFVQLPYSMTAVDCIVTIILNTWYIIKLGINLNAHPLLSLLSGRELSWRNISWLLFSDRNTSVCTECFTISWTKRDSKDQFKSYENFIPRTCRPYLRHVERDQCADACVKTLDRCLIETHRDMMAWHEVLPQKEQCFQCFPPSFKRSNSEEVALVFRIFLKSVYKIKMEETIDESAIRKFIHRIFRKSNNIG